MSRVIFTLSMPNAASWDGKWSGAGMKYFIVKHLPKKVLYFIGVTPEKPKNWYHGWSDGWGANVKARMMVTGERQGKSDGFCGYDWMVENIIKFDNTKEPGKVYG